MENYHGADYMNRDRLKPITDLSLHDTVVPAVEIEWPLENSIVNN